MSGSRITQRPHPPCARSDSLRIIVGLGNPGSGQAETPHNLGFSAMDALAGRHGLGPWSAHGANLVCLWPGEVGSRDPAQLVKPQLGMNLSGQALAPLLAERLRTVREMLVVADDVSLPLGRVKIRDGGGARGHQGLRSIESVIGKGFCRLCIGVGPAPPGALGEFVIGRMPPARRAATMAMVSVAVECAALWCAWGSGIAERFANTHCPAPERPDEAARR
jgi:PTH1 family peptidyl-tRNA hydrolase